jgi:hypothetical protein
MQEQEGAVLDYLDKVAMVQAEHLLHVQQFVYMPAAVAVVLEGEQEVLTEHIHNQVRVVVRLLE